MTDTTTPNIEELIKTLTQTNQFHESADICTSDVITVLQSQSERIKELEEAEEESSVDAVIIQYHEAAIKRLKIENDTLRAQLASIAATEPVAYMVQFSPGSRLVEITKKEFDSDLDGHLVYKKQAFYTHPMPAQDVTELVELLEFMWRDVSMNEYAFEKLEAALSKYKGAN